MDADLFDNSGTESSLTTITGNTDTHTVTIADDSNSTGGNIDLYQLSSISGIDTVTINGDTGSNIINLSDALTSSITTINLGSDSSADKVYFGVDDSSFTKSNTAGDVNYATVNDFNVNHDRVGLYYFGMAGGTVSAINSAGASRKRTSTSGGPQSISLDRTYIEEDVELGMVGMTGFDTATEVKEVIARAVSSFDTAANRLMIAHYTYDETADKNYAVINAADLTAIATKGDLVASDDFEVVGVAKIVGVAEGAMGTIGGNNLTATKPTGFGGRT